MSIYVWPNLVVRCDCSHQSVAKERCANRGLGSYREHWLQSCLSCFIRLWPLEPVLDWRILNVHSFSKMGRWQVFGCGHIVKYSIAFKMSSKSWMRALTFLCSAICLLGNSYAKTCNNMHCLLRVRALIIHGFLLCSPSICFASGKVGARITLGPYLLWLKVRKVFCVSWKTGAVTVLAESHLSILRAWVSPRRSRYGSGQLRCRRRWNSDDFHCFVSQLSRGHCAFYVPLDPVHVHFLLFSFSSFFQVSSHLLSPFPTTLSTLLPLPKSLLYSQLYLPAYSLIPAFYQYCSILFWLPLLALSHHFSTPFTPSQFFSPLLNSSHPLPLHTSS